MTKTSVRVAPLNSGKENGLEPILRIVILRVNGWAGRCHGKADPFPAERRDVAAKPSLGSLRLFYAWA